MIRTVAFRALLAAALVITIPGAATAQAEGPTLEGTEWHLVAYDAGGPELTPMPWDVVATLSFRKRQATGSTGCNGFGARYELDGEQMTISPRFLNQRACPAPKGEVEAAYWAALPKVARWDDGPRLTDDRQLILFDADDEQILRFSPSRDALLVDQIQALTDQLAAQQQEIAAMQARIEELEQGG
jgi:heat shock protein HslJ